MRVFLRSLLLCFFYISLSAFSRVDLGEREPLTHQFFDVLIQQSHEMDNSFLVLKVVSTQVIFYAPENFLNYVKDNFSEFSDPLTRQPISDMGIYRIPVGTEEVQFSREETDRFFEILLATIQEKRDNQILPKDIEIIRYIIKNRLFVEQLATNSTYFKDPRLIDIFAYIKDNIGGDLSNKVLANVANVSEDYVGQYFKMLTGINPQDYIEYQRMEAAVGLLRTSKKSIRAIGAEVGYKDTAYFCRRFKMMFGIPAGKMRRRESLMNV